LSLLLLAIAFVATGLTNVINKLIVVMGLGEYAVFFTLTAVATGLVVAGIVQLSQKPRIRRRDIVLGLVMGATGGLAMASLIVALRTIPAVTAFPVRSCANIALTAGVSYGLWRERVTPRQWLGIACAIASVYLLV